MSFRIWKREVELLQWCVLIDIRGIYLVHGVSHVQVTVCIRRTIVENKVWSLACILLLVIDFAEDILERDK